MNRAAAETCTVENRRATPEAPPPHLFVAGEFVRDAQVPGARLVRG